MDPLGGRADAFFSFAYIARTIIPNRFRMRSTQSAGRARTLCSHILSTRQPKLASALQSLVSRARFKRAFWRQYFIFDFGPL